MIGKYRAPKSPKNVDEFNWFCLKHVKEYNRKWNFFEGHSQQDLENQFKADSVWERKTSPLNSDVNKDKIQAEGKAWARLGLEDPYDLFSNKKNPNLTQRKLFSRRLPASERKALDILGASDTTTKSELRKITGQCFSNPTGSMVNFIGKDQRNVYLNCIADSWKVNHGFV